MRRIISTPAVCLHTAPVRESSKLVTLFTPDHGRVVCLAKGARRPRSRYGAALDRCAVSRVIYYWRESRATYTLTDAALVRSATALAQAPGRFLAAEQTTEFVLRATALHDPHPQLYQLLLTYFAALEKSDSGFASLVSSFLLKAASFLGFRPELRRCLICRKDALRPMPDAARPVSKASGVVFDAARGGIICSSCAGRDMTGEGTASRFPSSETGGCTEPGTRTPRLQRLAPDDLGELQRLLFTAADALAGTDSGRGSLSIVLNFLAHHFDPLLLNSFRWPEGL